MMKGMVINMKKVYFEPEMEIEKFDISYNIHTFTLSLDYESEYASENDIVEGKDITWE